MAPPPSSTAPSGARPATQPAMSSLSASSTPAAVAAAAAAAKKEKRAAAAAAAASMAPRMQSQVQIWAKKTAELAGNKDRLGHAGEGGRDDLAGGGGGHGLLAGDTTGGGGKTKTKKKTKKANKKGGHIAPVGGKPPSQLRAPHRHDRYVSFGIGGGIGGSAQASSSQPPTCLLCLVRFATRQQLRDHEALSTKHRRMLRDGTARRTALQRYAKVAAAVEAAAAAAAEAAEQQGGGAAETNEAGTTTASAAPPAAAPAAIRPPTHIKRLPRRKGDLAPVYTSYAAPMVVAGSSSAAASTKPESSGSHDAHKEPLSSRPPIHHCCLLCRRRFRSRATLRLHERESVLHRSRTRDPAAVAAAVAAVNAAAAAAEKAEKSEKSETTETTETTQDGDVAQRPRRRPPLLRPLLRMRPLTSTSSAATGASATQYRDRARERRLAFGQTGVPGKKRGGAGTGGTGGGGGGGGRTGAASSAPLAADTPAASKGAAMLGKMGWTAGLGLGAQGTGRTEAIATSAYMPGVGLGAQGGKLGDAADVAARRTEGRYQDFVEQTQEKARQRYLALAEAEAKAAETQGQEEGDEGKDAKE